MNNLCQMMLGWRLYADDFNDLLLASLDVGPAQKREMGDGLGGLQFNPSSWDPVSISPESADALHRE